MATPMTEVVLNEVTASERPPSSTPAPPPKPVDVPATANAWWLLGPGVSFPSDERGVRSTTRPAKSVWAAAALGLGTDEGAALAAALLDEKDWRHKYSGYLVKLAELQCISMPEQCIASCKAGLDAAAETFEWRRGSVTTTLKNAMTDAEYDAPSGKGLRSAVVRGSSSTSDEQSKTHANLFGPEVTKRAQGWATSGCAEGDVATALQDLDTNCEKWVKGSALKDTLFILLGGTSELCPLVPLLNVGANVACIARKSARLREAADIASKSTGGTLYMPLAPADGADDSQSTVFFENGTPLDDTTYSLAGANLTTQTPEIRTWLLELARSNEWTRVVIGSYAYADGEAHVRTSLASDAITHSLCTALGVDKTAVAFLSSPGTAFPIPEQCWTDAKFRHAQAEETEGSLFHWRKVVGFLGWGGVCSELQGASTAGHSREHYFQWQTVRQQQGYLQNLKRKRVRARRPFDFTRSQLRAGEDATELADCLRECGRTLRECAHGPGVANEKHAARQGGSNSSRRTEALQAVTSVRR